MNQRADQRRSHRIRLLIVDDMPDTATNVQKLLRFERDIQVVGVASSGREAIARAESMRPDIILMDINLQDMDGLRVTEIITREIPTCVVMMSVQSEPEYLTRAMMVGARGYLIKPFSSEDLVNTLHTAYDASKAQQPRQEPGRGGPAASAAGTGAAGQMLRKIIAVYSPKGGAGRSIVAANMAVALHQATKKSVVLVDANLQSGDAHVILNINTTTSIDDLREAGSLDQDIISTAVIRHEGSGIGLLRAPLSPESAELFTADAMKAILVELRDHFDYLIIDVDTHFSEATLTVLEMADQILVLTTLEVPAINRVSQFMEVAERLGYQRTKIKMVCNRVEQYYGIKPSQVEARLRNRFLAQIPEDSRLVAASVNRGVPFILSQKQAPISKSIQMLAQRVDELANLPPDGSPQDKRRWGIFSRS